MNNSLYAACCYFYLGMYQEARELVLKAPKCPLQVSCLVSTVDKKLMLPILMFCVVKHLG